ncbi:DUF1254 domain-containing protein [Hoeflea olei]|uniref:DUF1254 domain-containing protein n=1 Tax=Hoeflea olei TaxID=1480615 RepID=A0A1C1YQF9_9HYPH|nr:DUF1254 domain-containing protein [Hoeflea olei]OCW55755.1 hypothetical protein AWJ14_14815 [Hoeflea olei]
MRSVLLATAIGLVGAAIIHIIIVLALPMWTGKDAWTRVREMGAPNVFYALANEPNPTGLFNDDANIHTAVCHFDITEAPVRIIATGDVPIWTVAAYDTASNETFSMNDRSSIGENVDIAFVTPAQMLQLRRAMPASLERAVLVELQREQGYVALRAVAPLPSQEPAARAFLAGALCAPLKLDPA